MATPAEQLEGNIVATVATAESVLAHFERSLVDAGFAEGAQSYTRLAETLIGQRLWTETSGMAAGARFEAVAAHARSIHAMLVPYVEAFHRLAALSAPLSGDADGDASPEEGDLLGERILETLDAAGRPLSATALRAALGVPKAELATALDRLAEGGEIERRRLSGREHIRRSGTR